MSLVLEYSERLGMLAEETKCKGQTGGLIALACCFWACAFATTRQVAHAPLLLGPYCRHCTRILVAGLLKATFCLACTLTVRNRGAVFHACRSASFDAATALFGARSPGAVIIVQTRALVSVALIENCH